MGLVADEDRYPGRMLEFILTTGYAEDFALRDSPLLRNMLVLASMDELVESTCAKGGVAQLG